MRSQLRKENILFQATHSNNFIHTIIVGKPAVYTNLTEVTPQPSAFWNLVKQRPRRVLPPDGPISTRVVGLDAWLAAWQRRPQPPRSLWRPPFTSTHTIFMQERDFLSKNKPRLKRKQSALPQQIPANLPRPERRERSVASDGRLPV